jgi:CheY-like chemotaxis protein
MDAGSKIEQSKDLHSGTLRKLPEMLCGGCKMLTAIANLLIVEDDVALRTSLSAILATFGHRVRSAADGFSALAELRQEVPDIIVSDLNMPGMSGFEFLSVVRRRFPAIQVIAMSSAFVAGGVPIGVAADDFYQKGNSLGSLLRIVEAMTSPEGPSSHTNAGKPVSAWVGRDGKKAIKAAYVMLTCPECLRTFPQICGQMPSPAHETCCIYCDTLFHCATAQPAVAALHKPRTRTRLHPYIRPELQVQESR